MADLDDDAIEVTIPHEGDAGVITEIKPDPPPAKKAVADDPISDLKGQFETLKGTLNQTTQRLAGAERQLDVKDQEIAAARKEVATSQLDTVLTGIQAAEAEAHAAEGEYIAAAEAGNFVDQAKAQRKMAAAESRIQRLKEAEGDLKDQSATKLVRQEIRQESRPDPVEALASTLAPRAAAWIRSHPDCVTDKKLNARMMAAHNLAVADDVEEGSDEYFTRIEAGISTKVAPKQEEKDAKPRVQIRPSSAAAPNGNAGGGMNGGGMTIVLTKREALSATDGSVVWNWDDPKGKFKKGDPIGHTEFARRKSIMQREGHYDRSFNEQ